MRLFTHTVLTSVLVLAAAGWFNSSGLQAQTPSSAQLLPADTLLVVSIPDWKEASEQYARSPLGQLWQDPAVKAFKNKFLKKLEEELAGPLQQELGIRFDDYLGLVQGQITFAVTRNGWDGQSENSPGFLFLLDAGEKQPELAARLKELRQKWTDAGRKIRSERVRDVEFAIVTIDSKEIAEAMEKAFPSEDGNFQDEEVPSQQLEVRIGMAGSLLLAGTTARDLEGVLSRLSGGMAPSLAEQPAFQRQYAERLREDHLFAWFDFRPVYSVIVRGAQAAFGAQDSPFAPQPDKILSAIGLGALETISMGVRGTREGSFAEVQLGIPEAKRQGLFRILIPEPKEAGPPEFIPEDVTKFSRMRVDGQKIWTSLEQMLTAVSPELAGFLQMILGTVGKDVDPNFDFKRDLIGNLGDDFMSYQKRPRQATVEQLASPPSLFLVGSPNPDRLAVSFRALNSMIPGGAGAAPKTREFLGRTIHSFAFPGQPGGEPAQLHFVSAGGYLVLGQDAAVVEEFIRSHESPAQPLRQRAGLADAAAKIGGTQTGFFAFEDQRETMRAVFEMLKRDPAGWQNLLGMVTGGAGVEDGAERMKEWLDFNLLPPFEQIARYFHFMVYTARSAPEGFGWRFFAPVAPDFRN